MVIPSRSIVLLSPYLLHRDARWFPDPERFDPERFAGSRADTYGWIPFGGGVRRCIGAAFASLEMRVVLRTILRDFTLEPTTDAPERSHSRGIAVAPGRGGLAVVHRR